MALALETGPALPVILFELPSQSLNFHAKTTDKSPPAIMSSGSRPPRGPSNTSKYRSLTPEQRKLFARAEAIRQSELPSSSSGPQSRGAGPSNTTTTVSQYPSTTMSSGTDRGQSERGGQANAQTVDETTLRCQLSTAKSHLGLLRTLLQYDEYEGSALDLNRRIKEQQAQVSGLEQQTREIAQKEKKPTSRGLPLKEAFHRYGNLNW